MSTNTGIDFYLSLGLADFMDIANEVIEYGREQKDRIRNRDTGRR